MMNSSEPMVVIGCDHQRASSRWRAAVALNEQEQVELYTAMRPHGMVGMIQLATCNRTEWITLSERPQWAAQILEAQFQRRWTLAAEGNLPPVTKPYVLIGDDALRHLMSVSAGMKSFAQGERQIAGQVHRAFNHAREIGCSNAYLNMLETIIGKMTRQLSLIPDLGGDAIGINSVVVDRIRAELGSLSNPKAIVVGMGEIGQAIEKSLQYDGWSVTRYNRTPNTEQGWKPLSSLRGKRLDADVLIVATGSQEPTWLLDDMVDDDSPLIVDVGSPAQVEGRIKSKYTVIDLDDLLSQGRPLLSEELKCRVHDEINVAVGIFERKLLRHSWAEAWRVHSESYQQMSRESLPSCLSKYNLPPDLQAELEVDLKRLINDYGHRLLDGFSMALPGDDP